MSVVQAHSFLEASDVSYRAGSVNLLHAMSMKLKAGEVTAILGPNGAGKSTLLSLLSGQRMSGGAGRVSVNDRRMTDYSAAELARFRAVLPQDIAVAFDYTVQDIVELGRFPHSRKPSADETGIVQAAMRATRVQAFAHRIIHTLSGGERARAQLARVLAQIWEPTVEKNSPYKSTRWLLLDEPTAALDLSHQHDVLRLVRQWAKERGVGVVAVLHDVNLALRYADSVVVLKNGALVCHGAPADALNAATVSEVYNVKVQAVRDDAGVAQLLVA